MHLADILIECSLASDNFAKINNVDTNPNSDKFPPPLVNECVFPPLLA